MRIDREKDGKQELDFGIEELDKESTKMPLKRIIKEHERLVDVLDSPSHEDDKEESKKQKKELKEYKKKLKKSSLTEQWNLLKAKLNSDEAFLDLSDLDENGQEDVDEIEQQESPAPIEEPGAEEMPQEEDEDAHIEEILGHGNEEEGMEEQPEEEAQEGEEEGLDEEELEPDEEELVEALREAGYSDSEIGHIIHGHHNHTIDPVDQAKIESTQAKMESDKASADHDLDSKKAQAEDDREHNKSLKQLELEHAKRMHDLEYDSHSKKGSASDLDNDHKKRMQDLEYEYARKMKELELDNKKKDFDDKREQKKEQAKQKSKEKSKELKKAGGVRVDSNSPKMKWSHNSDSRDGIKADHFSHDHYGTVSLHHAEDGFKVVHNGKQIGVHENKADAVNSIKQHMNSLKTKLF